MTSTLRVESPWKALGKLYAFFLYFSAAYQLLILLSGTAGVTGLRQAVYMSLLWLVPPLLWPACTRRYAAIVGCMLWLTSLASLGYFAVYQQDFSESVIFIIFESNTAESAEFFQQYFRWWMLPAAILYGVLPLWLWSRLEPPIFSPARSRVIAAVVLCFTLLLPLVKPVMLGKDWLHGQANLQNRLEPATPWQLVIGYVKYRQQLADMNSFLVKNQSAPPLTHFQVMNPEAESTIVLVIGESTNSQRMGLYGYGRDTTPKLESIRDQLTVFKHVFSPRPYTIEVLQQALTFGDQHHPDLYLTDANILNVMKQAGYKTYWITNQQTVTARNTLLTTFSKQTDKQIYLNNNRMQNSSQYDEVVIEPFVDILSEDAKRKFIVVHLLGTHLKYRYRYPDIFSVFNDRDGVPAWIKDQDLNEYNEYDNAIRYNDYVVYGLISSFSEKDPNGYLLYLSDHGEEVYDDKGRYFNGRSEGNPSSSMYTVPFMVWTSPRWRNAHAVMPSDYQERIYSSSYLLHTLVDLSDIHFDQWISQRSVVSEDFVAVPVLIGNPAHPNKLRDVRELGWLETIDPQLVAEAGKRGKPSSEVIKTQTPKLL